MFEIPVKLIVKAPNQQIEDQTIHCCLSWTIKRLKGYLSEVYPSKPNTEDQRLIYYGQLLNDSVTLKDVFTRYEAGEETHTVHLVCMPSKETLKMQARKIAEENGRKIMEATSASESTAGQRLGQGENEPFIGDNEELRRRSSSSTSSPSTMGFPGAAAENYSYGANYQNWMNGSTATAQQYLQQWAWMQQVYAQYCLNQYMDMMARQNGFRETYGGQRPAEAAYVPEQPAPRDADDQDNRRDWLDYFCILSRLVVLLAILYFYSSPARFLLVSFLGMTLYLYRIGFFRLNQLQAAENNNRAVNNNNNINVHNNNNNNNNNINLNNDNDNIGWENLEMAERERGGDAIRGEEADVPGEANRAEEMRENVDQPSFVALTWTFFSSFFSSIIPEAQNAL